MHTDRRQTEPNKIANDEQRSTLRIILRRRRGAPSARRACRALPNGAKIDFTNFVVRVMVSIIDKRKHAQ